VLLSALSGQVGGEWRGMPNPRQREAQLQEMFMRAVEIRGHFSAGLSA